MLAAQFAALPTPTLSTRHSQHPATARHPLPVPAQPKHAPQPAACIGIAPQTMSSNIFAALAKSKSKKKPKADSDEKQQSAEKHAELEAAIFSAPSGALASNWADSEEEEDEEWGAPQSHANEEGWEEVRGSVGIAAGSRDRQAMCIAPAGRPPTHHHPLHARPAPQAKGGYTGDAANYGLETQQQPEPVPVSESEEEVGWAAAVPPVPPPRVPPPRWPPQLLAHHTLLSCLQRLPCSRTTMTMWT